MNFSLLNIGASDLYAAQRALEVTGQNVANAQTPGYTRQAMEITAGPPAQGVPGLGGTGMLGSGVVVTSLTRIRDTLTDVNFRSAAAASGNADAQSGVLAGAQTVLGSFDSGAPQNLDAFWKSWSTLSNSPSDTAARQGVLSAGAAIAGSLNAASSAIDSTVSDTAARISGGVTSLNDLIDQVAKLNGQIRSQQAANQAPNDLMDARDKALDGLAHQGGATIRYDSNGEAVVSLGSTVIVQGSTAAHLATSTAAPGALPTVTLEGSATPVALGGTLGGYQQAAGVVLPALKAQLNTLATGLRDAVNAIQTAGYASDGSKGAPFFTGTTAADLAVNPSLTAAGVAAATGIVNPDGSVTVSPLDGNNALAMAQLASTAVLGSPPQTVGGAMAALAGQLGSAAATAASAQTTSDAALQSATASRQATNGVNTDEEMVNLVQWQRSYEAAAKVISIADSCLNTVINGMGVGH